MELEITGQAGSWKALCNLLVFMGKGRQRSFHLAKLKANIIS